MLNYIWPNVSCSRNHNEQLHQLIYKRTVDVYAEYGAAATYGDAYAVAYGDAYG